MSAPNPDLSSGLSYLGQLLAEPKVLLTEFTEGSCPLTPTVLLL